MYTAFLGGEERKPRVGFRFAFGEKGSYSKVVRVDTLPSLCKVVCNRVAGGRGQGASGLGDAA